MSNIKSKVGRLPSNLNTPHRMNEGPLESENGKVHPSTVPPPNIPGPTNSQLMYLKNTVMQAVWNHKLSWPFQAPVDAMKSDIPDYHKTIKHPMDFGTIKKRLDDNYYWSAEECIKDFKRVFLNCYVHNKGGEGKAGEEVVMAQTVEKLFFAKLASMPKEEQEADPSPIESTEPAKHYSFDGQEIPENEIVTVILFGIKKDTMVAWNFHNNKSLDLDRLVMVERNAPPLIFMHKGNLIDPLGWCTPKSLDIKNDDYILVLRPLELREHWDDESRITLIMVDRERMLRYGKLKLNEKLEVKYLKRNLEKLLKLKHSFSLVHDGLILGDDDTLEGAGIVDNECIALVDLKGDVSDRHLERSVINAVSQNNNPCTISMDKSTVVPVGEPRGMRIIHNLDPNNIDGHENEKCAEVCKSLIERIKTKFVGELTAALSTQDDVQSKFSYLIASKMFHEHAHAGDLLSDIHETLILLKAKHKIEDSVWKDVMGRVIDFYLFHTDSVFKNSCGRYYEPFESFPIFSEPPSHIHSLETVLYIGPIRDGKPRPTQPIVKLRAFTSQTTIQDVINSYKVYAKLSNCKITGLSFNNRLASPTELVSQVLGGLFEKNYLMFSDVIEASDLGELDNIVEFIEGKKEEKIQRKKKKKVKDNKIPNLDEVSQAEVCEAPLEHHLDIPNMSILTENMSLEVSDYDKGSCRKKLLLEASLKSKTDLLNENKSIVEQLFGSKSKEMKDLLIQMSQVEDANILKGKRMTSIDLEIDDLEARVAKLKEEKHLNNEEMDLAKTKVQKLNIKRIKLETYIETEMKKRKERENELKSDIKDVEEKIKALDKSSTSGKSNEFGSNDETADKDPKQKLLDFLTTSILEKEVDLECPVCLDTATIPIYSCLESHLICSSCRPKVVECPECRVEYGDKEVLRRHRYAEKTAIELERLKEERMKVL